MLLNLLLASATALPPAHHGIGPERLEACVLESAALDEFEALLPADPVVLIRAASLSELLDPLARLQAPGAAGPSQEWFDRIAGFGPLGQFPTGSLDFQRPLGFAITLDAAGSPHFTLVLPASDPDELTRHAAAMAPTFGVRAAGGFVVLESTPARAAGGSRTAAPSLGSNLSVMVDLARLRAAFGPLLEAGLDQTELQLDARANEDLAAAVALEQVDDWRRWLANAELLDAHLDADRWRLEARATVSLKDDGWVRSRFGDARGDVLGLARLLDPDAALSWVLAGDMPMQCKRHLAALRAVESALEPRLRPLARLYSDALETFAAGGGDASVLNVSFGADGLDASLYLACADPVALCARLAALLAAPTWGEIGLSFTGPAESLVSGVTWREYAARLDVEVLARWLEPEARVSPAELAELQHSVDALLGSSGLRIALAPASDVAILQIGGAEARALESVTRATRPRPVLTSALADAFSEAQQASSASIAHLDLGRLLEQLDRFAAGLGQPLEVPAALAGERLPLTFYSAIAPQSLRAGVSLDVRELTRFAEALRRAR